MLEDSKLQIFRFLRGFMTTLSEIKQNVSVGRGLCQEVFQRKSLATSRYMLPLNEPKHWSSPQ